MIIVADFGGNCFACLNQIAYMPERQIDPFPNIIARLGDFMFPELLHRSSHDEQRTVRQEEEPGLLGLVVLDAELPGSPQRQ